MQKEKWRIIERKYGMRGKIIADVKWTYLFK